MVLGGCSLKRIMFVLGVVLNPQIGLEALTIGVRTMIEQADIARFKSRQSHTPKRIGEM